MSGTDGKTFTLPGTASATLLKGIEEHDLSVLNIAQVQALIEIRQEVAGLKLELVKTNKAIHAFREECKRGNPRLPVAPK